MAGILTGGCDRQAGETAQPKADGARADTAAASAPPKAEATGTIDRSQAGSPLPAVTATDTTGASLDLTSLKGKPVLLNLWATWCAPCVAELPTLEELSRKSGDSLVVLAVSQDMQPAKVAPFLKERGIKQLHPWLDEKADLSFKLGASTLPMTILYDAQGREVWRFAGGHDWAGADAARLIAEARAN